MKTLITVLAVAFLAYTNIVTAIDIYDLCETPTKVNAATVALHGTLALIPLFVLIRLMLIDDSKGA